MSKIDNPSSVSIGTPIGSGTAGSVLFVDASGNLGQRNPGFTYDNSTLNLNANGTSLIQTWGNVSGTALLSVNASGYIGTGSAASGATYPVDFRAIYNGIYARFGLAFAFSDAPEASAVGAGAFGRTSEIGLYNYNGAIGFYTAPPGFPILRMSIDGTGAVLIPNGTSTVVPFTVKGAASQSANLTEWQNSSAAILSRVESDGTMSSPGSGTDSQHFGHASVASGNDSTAFGHFARASGNQSTALGSVSNATNTYSMAVGQSAAATGSGAFALGSSASASGTNCVALGTLANNTGAEALSLGTTSAVTANYSTALGFNATVSHAGSMALGHTATTTKTNQLVIGSSTIPVNEVLFASANPLFQLAASTNIFIVKGASSQSANTQEWHDNSANILASIDASGKVANYKGVATAGWGVPAIYGSGRSTAQTGDVASVATYTVGAADGSFLISANFNVTAYTAGSQSVQCTYTDETNTSRTFTFTFSNLTGTLATAIGATGPYESFPAHIRCKASTAITIKSVGTVWTGTYNVEGLISQIA